MKKSKTPGNIKRINLTGIKTFRLKSRKSRVSVKDFGYPVTSDLPFSEFLSSLPDILKGKELRDLASRIIQASRSKRPVILMFGGHLIKCGLGPLVIELMKKKVVTAIATNGSGVIHDFEIAYAGKTSEDVQDAVKKGMFGMAEETGAIINKVIKDAQKKGRGAGFALGDFIAGSSYPFKEYSFLAGSRKYDVPVTVHIAIGTDVIHQHKGCSGAALGECSMIDFHSLVSSVSGLSGGVVLNFGSAVILPEVFIKALNLSRNLGSSVRGFTVANFDMIKHYRPSENLIRRPGGKGFYFIGHHEIMFPMLTAAVLGGLRCRR